MTNFGYQDYFNHLYDVSQRVERIGEQILANSVDYLDDLTAFLQNQFVDNSEVVQNLTYAKVEAIKETIQKSSIEGFRLYVCVVNLNNITISQRPNLSTIEIYSSFADDEQIIDRLLDRYDVVPVIERYKSFIFNDFLDRNPEFLNYAFKETNFLGTTIYIAVQNSYLLCMSSCE